MVRVTVAERETLDRAIMRFKRKCDRAGVLREFKRSTYYLKPSQRKRIRRVTAIRRAHRSQLSE
ncbi:30S ribosomal protein S21 [candidate division KSB1 bacterium]|nr:30S ribosomal protein S21 [candidate division KSB1 bacterium]